MAAADMVIIDYTNHEGERSLRRITPIRSFFGTTEYHPKFQLLLEAFDHEKNDVRIFASRDIHDSSPSSLLEGNAP